MFEFFWTNRRETTSKYFQLIKVQLSRKGCGMEPHIFLWDWCCIMHYFLFWIGITLSTSKNSYCWWQTLLSPQFLDAFLKGSKGWTQHNFHKSIGLSDYMHIQISFHLDWQWGLGIFSLHIWSQHVLRQEVSKVERLLGCAVFPF